MFLGMWWGCEFIETFERACLCMWGGLALFNAGQLLDSSWWYFFWPVHRIGQVGFVLSQISAAQNNMSRVCKSHVCVGGFHVFLLNFVSRENLPLSTVQYITVGFTLDRFHINNTELTKRLHFSYLQWFLVNILLAFFQNLRYWCHICSTTILNSTGLPRNHFPIIQSCLSIYY